MNQEQMQQMTEQMQKMQACMENVDQAELQAFEKRAKLMDREVKALCAKGERDEAQQTTMAFSREVATSRSLQEMRKCGQSMPPAVNTTTMAFAGQITMRWPPATLRFD